MKKRTLQEKAEAILHITLPCGCPATYTGIFEGYTVDGEHQCDGSVLAAEAKQAKEARRQFRSESYQRQTQPRSATPFSLMRTRRQ